MVSIQINNDFILLSAIEINNRFPLLNRLMIKKNQFGKKDNTSKKARLIYNFFKMEAFKSHLITRIGDFPYQSIDLDMSFWYIAQKCEKKAAMIARLILKVLTANQKRGNVIY